MMSVRDSLSPQEALAVMDTAQRIAIAGHINPDGDALGSALALQSLLRAMGKDVTVLLGQDHAPPELYKFLPNYEFVWASEYSEVPDLFIVVDASTAKRLGNSERILGVARDTLVIDHHTNYEGFAHHYIGDTMAPAAATLIWRIIKASGITPTLDMATYCYVGIMTDTGRFAFKNTNASAFADASEMIGIGVDPAGLSELVYENKTLPALRLEALMTDRIQFSGAGSIAYSFILKDDLRTLGLERDVTEQLPAILRAIKGVEVAALFREEGREGIRVNLRSRSSFNVGAFAREFGGGGHAGAAGLTLEQPLDEAISCVVERLASELSAHT
ncbi:MAG: bifunctional oligoribonuclease/PAP phosphatase NrnA [Coriobacteriales bacterium]|jgi:phosphoesterase RecJ-like protein|nr:bifunctional oligoribonuclease/PAP phosphatase NrnA [Coriobacteriales bacterium]